MQMWMHNTDAGGCRALNGTEIGAVSVGLIHVVKSGNQTSINQSIMSVIKGWQTATMQYSPTSIASNVFDSLWDFSTTFRRRRNLLFQLRLQIFRRRVGIFSHFFLCCFYFLLKVHVNFLQFSIGTRAVVRSSRRRPFCFYDFVFLLNCFV